MSCGSDASSRFVHGLSARGLSARFERVVDFKDPNDARCDGVVRREDGIRDHGERQHPLLRPVRHRDRQGPAPGVAAATRRSAALLQRAARLLRARVASRTSSARSSTGTRTDPGGARRSRSSRRTSRSHPASSCSRTRPIHDVHRSLLSRVFTPGKMNAIEPKVREYCARTLDPLVGLGTLRLHHRPRRGDAHAHDRDAAGCARRGPGGDPRPARPEPARRRRRHR